MHLDDKRTPALQAADMIAGIGKELGTQYIMERKQVELSRAKGIFHKLVSWNKQTMLESAARNRSRHIH